MNNNQATLRQAVVVSLSNHQDTASKWTVRLSSRRSLVHHCGPSASGEYVCTIQMIDVATGWSERRAVLGRSYLVMEDAFRYILTRLPFPIVEIHPDPVLGRPWSFGPVLRPPSVLGPCT